MNLRILSAALAAVLALTACGGGGDGDGAPMATPSSTSMQRPPTAQDTYFALADATFEASSEIYERHGGEVIDETVREFCAEMVTLEEGFADDIETIEWPAELQDEADAVVAAEVADVAAYRDCAEAETMMSAQGILQSMYATSTASDAAMRMSSALGQIFGPYVPPPMQSPT